MVSKAYGNKYTFQNASFPSSENIDLNCYRIQININNKCNN